MHGIEPGLIDLLVNEPAAAGIEADAAAVYAAGWSEQALFHAISTYALYSFMNRLIEDCGVVTDPGGTVEERARYHALKDDPATYRTFCRQLSILR